MRRVGYLTILLLFMLSCEDDDFDNAARNVVADDGQILFEEMVMLLNVKTSDSTYLVTSSIDSVKIHVNGKYWSTTNSNSMDTSTIPHYNLGNQSLSDQKVQYLLLASQDVKEPNAPTAGDYADYLNALYSLKPGEYACFIESFRITYNDSTTEVYKPMTYEIFEVKDKTRSTYVGEFDLKTY